MPPKPSNSLIKPPNKQEVFTPEQVVEYAKCFHDPLYFMSNYFHVQTNGDNMLYKPYSYQTEMITIFHEYRHSISLLPRQMGKTVSAAGFLLWKAMFQENQKILIASYKYEAAQEIMDRIRHGYEMCPDFIRCGVAEYNKQSIVFDNRSTITSQTTTAKTGRGKSITLLYLDEFSFVEPRIAREMWTSVYPTISTGGKIIITSTPCNPDDLFSELWAGANRLEDDLGNTIEGNVGANGFKAMTAKWQDHPDRDEKWANEQKIVLGEEKFAREIECQFIQTEETLINPFHLSNMKGDEPLFKMGQVRFYKRPSPDYSYIVALDPSMGTGGDYAAIQIFEANTKEQVAEWRHNRTSIEDQISLLKELTAYLVSVTGVNENVYYSVENNGLGEATLVAIRNIGEENIPGIFVSETNRTNSKRILRRGFTTTNPAKLLACNTMKAAIEKGIMKVHSKPLVSEFRNFISVGNTYKARGTEHDDLVTSLLLVIRIMDVLKGHIAELSDIEEKKAMDNMPLPFFVSFNF